MVDVKEDEGERCHIRFRDGWSPAAVAAAVATAAASAVAAPEAPESPHISGMRRSRTQSSDMQLEPLSPTKAAAFDGIDIDALGDDVLGHDG